eukprot:6317856-Pyramimonas_sp.AAC.1
MGVRKITCLVLSVVLLVVLPERIETAGDRLVAIGDLHGDYKNALRVLQLRSDITTRCVIRCEIL